MNEWHETEIRVRYAETDQMGVVHHANYLVWFEVGRSELCRAKGFSYREMEEKEDSLMVVAEAYCRYKSPAFYDDLVVVRTRISEMRSRSLRFIYEVVRPIDNVLIAEGETNHVVTDKAKRVRQLPDVYRQLLTAEPIDTSVIPDEAPH